MRVAIETSPPEFSVSCIKVKNEIKFFEVYLIS